jgi:hypothetical protein
MEDIRYPIQLLDYRPIRRRPGRPLKRLLDGYNSKAETGHLLVSFPDQKKKIKEGIIARSERCSELHLICFMFSYSAHLLDLSCRRKGLNLF